MSLGSAKTRTRHFGTIGVQQRLFTKAQLADATRTSNQRRTTPGQVLVEQGVVTPDQLRALERAITYRIGREEDKQIAKIIVDSNYCEAPRVEAALRKQKEFYSRSGELMRLGVLLVDDQNLTESQRVAAYKIHSIERQSESRRP